MEQSIEIDPKKDAALNSANNAINNFMEEFKQYMGSDIIINAAQDLRIVTSDITHLPTKFTTAEIEAIEKAYLAATALFKARREISTEIEGVAESQVDKEKTKALEEATKQFKSALDNVLKINSPAMIALGAVLIGLGIGVSLTFAGSLIFPQIMAGFLGYLANPSFFLLIAGAVAPLLVVGVGAVIVNQNRQDTYVALSNKAALFQPAEPKNELDLGVDVATELGINVSDRRNTPTQQK
jgi:hypothetical protein